jgi:hypothetical protein
MSNVTVKDILALINRSKPKLALLSEHQSKDILYIDLSVGLSKISDRTEVYPTPDGSEVHLDLNKDGQVIGIEFY